VTDVLKVIATNDTATNHAAMVAIVTRREHINHVAVVDLAYNATLLKLRAGREVLVTAPNVTPQTRLVMAQTATKKTPPIHCAQGEVVTKTTLRARAVKDASATNMT
jgi:predicted kinase